MSGPQKSAHGLNQWVSADKPTMADFNADNAALESNVYWKDTWAADYDSAGDVKTAGGIPGYALSKAAYDGDGAIAGAGGIAMAIQKNGGGIQLCRHSRVASGTGYVNKLACDNGLVSDTKPTAEITFIASSPYYASEGFEVDGTPARAQTTDGKALPAGYFAQGAGVSCTLTKSAEELVLNFKPGGGGIGVTVAAELPDTVTHNAITVISDRGAPAVTLDTAFPAAPQDGDLFIQLSGDSDILLTNGSTVLRLKAAFQFEDGLWRSREAYAAIGGQWKKFSEGTFVWEYCIDRVSGNITYTGANAAFNNAAMLGSVFNGGDWMDKWPFSAIRPCLLKDGKVQYYLDPNDYTKRENGLTADITSGNDGDVMVEFPLIARKVRTEGGCDYVSLASFPLEGYTAHGFVNLNGEVQPKCYFAAYEGFSLDGKLRSISGKALTISANLSAFRTLAEANGQGYHLEQWSLRNLFYDLFTLLFRGLNSQTLLGYGRANGQTTRINTGTMNEKGIYWGDTAGKNGVKCFGIENLWGNVWTFCDGLGINTNNNLVFRADPPYSNDQVAYTDSGITRGVTGYVSQMGASGEWGKLPIQTQGSTTTFYADQWIFPTTPNTYAAYGGGSYSNALAAGLFSMELKNIPTFSAGSIGSYLSCIPVASETEIEG